MSIVTKFFGKFHGGKQHSSITGHDVGDVRQRIGKFSTLVQPAPESKPRTPFDSPHVKPNKFGGMRLSQFPDLLSTMLPLVLKMRQGSKLYDGKFQPTADTATPEFIEKLEKLARQGGARDIRYIKVPRNAIFAGKGLPYQICHHFYRRDGQRQYVHRPQL